MHILITVNAAWNIWNFRRPLVSALIEDGYRITILAPADSTAAELENLGCRFVPLEMSVGGINPAEDLELLYRLRRVFASEQPDVILSYTIKNNIYGALAARKLKLPFIPNVTGLGTAFLSRGPLQAIAEALYRRAFAQLPVIFFQNQDDRDLFVKRRLARPEQAQLLAGSGIDLVRFAPAEMPPADEPPVFLMIGRLLRDKGTFEFVEAARRIKAERPDVRFQILGAVGADNRTAINAIQVDEWVAEGIIEYLGTTSDVRPYVRAATSVVLPSYREGAPRTLIEAAAMARPLIATDVPGCRAVLDQDVSGLFCEARDADSLAAAMRRFLHLPHEARVAMGRAGRAKMEREFDEAFITRAYRRAIASQAPYLSSGVPAVVH